MSAPILLPHQLNPRRVINYRSMIETIRDRMVPIGVPSDCFANIVALEHGYFDKMLMSLLRPFEKIEDANEIKSILLIGVSKRFFDTISGAAPANFYRFLKWLKTGDGQASLQQVQFEKSLVKRGKGKFTAREVAIVAMFEHQLSEYNKRDKAIRAECDAEIADLERHIRQLRHERDIQMQHSLSFVDDDADCRAAKKPRNLTGAELFDEAASENNPGGPNPDDIFKTVIVDPASTKWGSWAEELEDEELEDHRQWEDERLENDDW